MDSQFIGFPTLRLPRPDIVQIGGAVNNKNHSHNQNNPSTSTLNAMENARTQHRTVGVQTTTTEGNNLNTGGGGGGGSGVGFLLQKNESTAWQERIWELQQITYLMDTLVPTREFYRTRAGIGASSEASIRYYKKPNSKPPPIQATKSLLWNLHREICTSRSLQAIDNWQYLRRRLELLHIQHGLEIDAHTASTDEQEQENEQQWEALERESKSKHSKTFTKLVKTKSIEALLERESKSKNPNLKRENKSIELFKCCNKWCQVSEANVRVWEQRRVMFTCQRNRRWEQCLDSLINLSNYSNSNQHPHHGNDNITTTNNNNSNNNNNIFIHDFGNESMN